MWCEVNRDDDVKLGGTKCFMLGGEIYLRYGVDKGRREGDMAITRHNIYSNSLINSYVPKRTTNCKTLKNNKKKVNLTTKSALYSNKTTND